MRLSLCFVLLIFSNSLISTAELQGTDIKVLKTLHFNIYHQSEVSDSAIVCAEMAEKSHVYVSDYLSFIPDRVINIFLLAPGSPDFSPSKPDVNDPCSVSLQLNGDDEFLQKELTRRIVNSFQRNLLNDELKYFSNIIIDGMAEYLSAGFDEIADMAISDIIQSGKENDFFNFNFLNSDTEINAGKIDLHKSFYYFLETEYGYKVFGKLLNNIKCYSLQKSIELTAGKPIDEIIHEWVSFYKRRHTNDVTVKKTGYHELFNNNIITLSAAGNNGIYLLIAENKKLKLALYDLLGKSYEILNHTFKIPGDFIFSDEYPSVSEARGLIAYTKKNNIVCIDNITSAKTLYKIKLPFLRISDLNISADGTLLAFAGSAYNSNDIYLYNIKDRSLKRITDDRRYNRYPIISPDNSYIIYTASDHENKNTKLYSFDLKSGKSFLLSEKKIILHPKISPDNAKIIFTSLSSGVFRIFIYDLITGEESFFTNIQSNSFFPVWLAENKISFGNYYDMYFHPVIAELNAEILPENKQTEMGYRRINYPDTYYDLKDSYYLDYENELKLNFFSGIGLSENFLTGKAGLFFHDALNRNQIVMFSEYVQEQKNYDYAFDINYEYLKYKPDFGAGIGYNSNVLYYLTNPFSDLVINDQMPEPALNYQQDQYKILLRASFSLCKNFSLNGRYSLSAYGEMNNFQNELSNGFGLSLAYKNNFKNNIFKPANKHEISYLKTFNASSSAYDIISFNTNNIFLFWKMIILLNGKFGKVFVHNDDFTYFLKSSESEIVTGRNIAVFESGLYFRLIDRLIINRLYYFRINDIYIGCFFNTGNAWDYGLKNTTLNDFFYDTGLNLKISLYKNFNYKFSVIWPNYNGLYRKHKIKSEFIFQY